MDKEKEDKKTGRNNFEDDEKSITSQVLEYYQQYSQNRDLPKYFCGDTAIKPQDWQLTKIDPIKIDTGTENVGPVSTDVEKEVPKIAVESVCAPSPTSSVTSNRKLEWDNGADIGYSHSNIHKSISLPTLINNLELDKLRAKFKNSDKKKQTNDVSVDANIKLFDLSSLESTRSSRKGYILTTPSSDSNHDFLSDSEMCKSDHIKDLKSNVGLPIAESTPIVGEYCLTPNVKENVNEKLDLRMVDRISQYKNMKVLKLTVSNTVVVECAAATEPFHGKNKLVQTSPQTNPTIGIQTDFDYTNCHIIKPSIKTSERQSVFYMCFAESDTSATPYSTIQTQTNSIELSNCDSFEYVDGAVYPQPVIVHKSNKNLSPQETKPLDELCEESPLCTLLRKKLESNSIKDLQRNIDLLQKLISSQKYDAVTKKYYVKKIIQKILDNKSSKSQINLSETSKSTKENKFEQDVPSQTCSKSNSFYSKVPENKIEHEIPYILSESSRRGNSPSEVSDIPFENAKDTISQDRDIVEVPIKNTKKNRLGIHTFSNNEIFSKVPSRSGLVSISAKRKKLQRSPLLTLTDGGTSVVNDCFHDEKSILTSTSQKQHTSNSQGSSSSLKESEVGNKHRNWRDSKTNSEINLEQRIGDCNYPLINFAKKERDSQLYWINNEIVHLNKLKKVLEVNTTESTKNKLDRITRTPRIEDMKGINKQTTVYVLSTDWDKSPNGRSSINSQYSPRSCRDNLTQRKCNCKPPCGVNNCSVDVGNGKINLHNAQLVANEEFTCNSKDNKCTTVVRRYTFEILSDSEKEKNNYDSKAPHEANTTFQKIEIPLCLPQQPLLNSEPDFSERSKKNLCCKRCKCKSSNVHSSEIPSETEIGSPPILPRQAPVKCCVNCKCEIPSETEKEKNNYDSEAPFEANAFQRIGSPLNSESGFSERSKKNLCCKRCKCKSSNVHSFEIPPETEIGSPPILPRQASVNCKCEIPSETEKEKNNYDSEAPFEANAFQRIGSPHNSESGFSERSKKNLSSKCCVNCKCQSSNKHSLERSKKNLGCKCCVNSKCKNSKIYSFEIPSETKREKNNYDSEVQYEANTFKKDDSPLSLPVQSPVNSEHGSSKRSKKNLCCKCCVNCKCKNSKKHEISSKTEKEKNNHDGSSKRSKKNLCCKCCVKYKCKSSKKRTSEIPSKSEKQKNNYDSEVSKKNVRCQCCLNCKCENSKQVSRGNGTTILNENKSTCTCNDKLSNLTKNLVSTDEIASNNKLTRNVATGEKKPPLSSNLVMTDEILCSDVQSSSTSKSEDCGCSKEQNSEPESDSDSKQETQSESTSSEIFCTCESKLCCCCKQKEAVKPSGPCRCCKISTNDNKRDPQYLLCYLCYQHHGAYYNPYLFNTHICNCYLSDTVNNINKTIKQLENLESETELCQCCKKKQRNDDNVCSKCNCKLKSRYRRRKGGLAYSLTLEPDENLRVDENKVLMESLEDIKVPVPSPRKSKNGNASKRSSPTSKNDYRRGNCCKCTKKTDEDLDNTAKNRKKRHVQTNNRNVIVSTCICESNSLALGYNKNSIEKFSNSSEASNETEPNVIKKNLSGSQPSDYKSKKPLSLQEYLRKNNPNFVSRADERRKLLNKLSSNRGRQFLKIRESLISSQRPSYKSPLKSSQNYLFNSHKSGEVMFSSREMKLLTAKNYKKCNEFQQKLMDVREREIKRCNKLLYDVFNKRLREQVLKGRHTLPLKASIVNLR